MSFLCPLLLWCHISWWLQHACKVLHRNQWGTVKAAWTVGVVLGLLLFGQVIDLVSTMIQLHLPLFWLKTGTREMVNQCQSPWHLVHTIAVFCQFLRSKVLKVPQWTFLLKNKPLTVSVDSTRFTWNSYEHFISISGWNLPKAPELQNRIAHTQMSLYVTFLVRHRRERI